MHKNRVAPTPIFNARKRPCQAVIAEQGARTGPSGDTVYQGLMPPGGFNNRTPYPTCPIAPRGDANQGQLDKQNCNVNRQAAARNGLQPQTSTYSRRSNQPGAAQNMQYQRNMQQRQASMQINSQKNQPIYNQPKVDNLTTGNQYPMGRAYTFSRQRSGQQDSSMSFNDPRDANRPGMSMSNANHGGQNQWNGGMAVGYSAYNNPQTYNYTMGTNPPHNPLWQYQPIQDRPCYQSNPSMMPVDDDSLLLAPTQKVDNATKVQKQPDKKKSQTQTLRLLTVRASGLQRCAKHKDNLQLMFEVYGYLDSAIGRSQSDCKEFLLRDDMKDAISCVFFEIDRQICKMTRGQWYRVVGNYEQRTERLRCVSVRPMAETERSQIQALVDRSSQEIARVTRRMREQ